MTLTGARRRVPGGRAYFTESPPGDFFWAGMQKPKWRKGGRKKTAPEWLYRKAQPGSPFHEGARNPDPRHPSGAQI